MEIKINLDGEVLEELQQCVTDVIHGGGQITLEQYTANIIALVMDERIRGEYVKKSRKAPLSELKQKMGSFRKVRTENQIMEGIRNG